MHDVVVIGGGPVGSRIACRMAGYGYSVLVLEKRTNLREKVCCTGIIGIECLASFGIDPDLILRRASSAKIFSPSKKLIKLQRQQDQAVIIDRSAFDFSMAERAKAAGAEYCLDTNVRDIIINDDEVIIEAENNDKKIKHKARVVVIAAGFGSRLVERAGLGRTADFVFGAQTEVNAPDINEIEIYAGDDVAPDFFAWLVPTLPSKALVGLMARKKPRQYLEKFITRLQAESKINGMIEPINSRGIPLRPLSKTYSQRLIIAGDSAGQVKPITGGGVYFGLLSADMAAASLKEALDRDDLSARSLASYQKLWKEKLGKEINTGYRARKIYEKLSDGQVDKIVDIILNKGLIEDLLNADDLSFDWHGKAIARLLRRKALFGVWAVIKSPFI